MKKITAYINTVRVHWLVEELEAIAINEIMVTEYFSPTSKISRMELLAHDNVVEKVREIIHRVGTTGEAADHSLFIEEFDPSLPSQIPLGQRASRLEESRVKQLVRFLLYGSHRKIRTAFLIITIIVLGVALFIGVQTDSVWQSAKETMERNHLLSEKVKIIENAVLEEMLAVECYHRGEDKKARRDFKEANVKLTNAIAFLQNTNIALHASAKPQMLAEIERKFHSIVSEMFDIADTLSGESKQKHRRHAVELSHSQVMASLDSQRQLLVIQLASFETAMSELLDEKQNEIERSTQEVRISLFLLIGAALGLTAAIWIIIERNVSRPIQKLVEEAKVIDMKELQ